MPPITSVYQLSDIQLCEADGCNRWWQKAHYDVLGSRSSTRCPHCRGVDTKPTKYWIGGPGGPKGGSYDYPGYVPSQSAKRSSEAENSSSSNKKPKLQAPSPLTPTSNAKPRVERRDSIHSTVPSPTIPKADPALQTLLLTTSNLYEAWKNCDGHYENHLQSELVGAESNLKKMQASLPKIERKVKESQEQLSVAQATLERMEVMWNVVKEATTKAGLDEDPHKELKNDWLHGGAQKHVQLAFEDNNGKSRDYQKGMEDLAHAKRLIVDMKQKITEVEEQRKRIKAFGEFFCVELPSKNSA